MFHDKFRASRMRRCRSISIIYMLAGAPGFEPGDGGIKIRCLTTWLRPKTGCAPRIAVVFAAINEALPTPKRPSYILP